MLDNQELPSKELEQKGRDLSDKTLAELYAEDDSGEPMTEFATKLWEENQHLRAWTRENIKEESEWATKYMQAKEQLTTTQQALDSAVEALRAGKEAIEIFILEKAAQDDTDSMAELFEFTKTSAKKVHELIAERYNKIEAALASIKE